MGEDYPRSLQELERRFATEAACLACLAALRWPAGFVCPACGGTQARETTRGLRHCQQGRTQTSVTAGTLFHRTRLPLPVWFRAIWHVTSQKYGANALGLQRVLGLSYETAWQWLHKLRRAMVRPGRDQLAGCVQVDETYVGGRKKSGKRGRGAAGKTLVAIAVEDKSPQGIGRIRLHVLPNASVASLECFAGATIAPGSVIATDDWSGYGPWASRGYTHRVLPPKDLVLPHLVASLVKRWLLGTYQGRSNPRTWRTTWMSLRSALIGGRRAAAGNCSTDSCSTPCAWTPCPGRPSPRCSLRRLTTTWTPGITTRCRSHWS
jgi:transposase-like protein